MENIIISFVVSVLASWFASFISKRLNNSNKLDFDMEPKLMHKNVSKDIDDDNAEIIREQNRKNLNDKFSNFLFYFISYIVVSAAFFCPLIFSKHFLAGWMDFNETKLAIDYILYRDDYIIASAICGFFFYIPILYLSKKGAYLLSLVLTNFWKITPNKKIALRLIVIAFLAVFLAANVFYILKPNLLWWDAIKTTFLMVLFVFTLGMSNP